MTIADLKAKIGVPWIQDPVTKQPSVSLTFAVVSFVMCVAGLINHASQAKWLGNIDETNAYNLFLCSSALYFGRKASDKLTGG